MALDGRAWENTIKRVSEGIVSLRVNYVRPFDGAGPNYSLATGFVVDAKRGVILTNRHVVTAGPVRGVATFLNKEEVPVFPLYRDPVHDFAFFRFDPRRVKFMRVIQIPLAPEEAKVGVEVRVVGNDAGEKLSILSGTLARLDREAPHYSSHGYNDFNTFYFSAASSTSGGSSGSPVLNIDGKAVALNAGGRVKEATSFYFPLDRVVRALRIILCPALSEDGAPTLTSFNTAKVFRGTIQTVFKHRPFDETRRLGLPDARESEVRSCFSDSTGMLVVEECVPSGPGDVAGLCPGDILISLNGVLCVGFVELEAQLDMAAEARMADGAGGSVEFVVWRSGSEHKVVVPVSDLHALVPSTILEVGASVLHTLSYHQAINYHVPCRGVFVAWAGYMLKRFGVTAHVLVDELDGVPTPDLDTFRRVFETFPNAQQVPLRYRMLSNHHVSHVSLVTVERTWFPMQSSTRDDSSGLWKSTSSPPPPDKQQVEVQSTTFMKPARLVLLFSWFSPASSFLLFSSSPRRRSCPVRASWARQTREPKQQIWE
jgi:S1-C subfamily serine protease